MVDSFAVGVRVKVVAPDKNDNGTRFVGRSGYISCNWRTNKFGYEWGVTLDNSGEEWPFASEELALEENEVVGIAKKVLEGELQYGDGQFWVSIDGECLTSAVKEFAGKRVRITVEEI